MLKTVYSAGAWFALMWLAAGTSHGVAMAEDRFTPCSDAALPALAGSFCANQNATTTSGANSSI